MDELKWEVLLSESFIRHLEHGLNEIE